MGFDLLQKRDELKPLGKTELVNLAEARCSVQTTKSTPWALQRICEREQYESNVVIDFFDF